MSLPHNIFDSLLDNSSFNALNIQKEAEDSFKRLLSISNQIFISNKEYWNFLVFSIIHYYIMILLIVINMLFNEIIPKFRVFFLDISSYHLIHSKTYEEMH